MSSSRPTAIRVLRLRVKDKHAAWLSGLAREVNTVFNYCNELSVKVFERERRFLSGFDFWPFLKGVTRGDCALHLPVQAVQEIAEEYARRRRQHQKIRLAWRKSGGARRSLGSSDRLQGCGCLGRRHERRHETGRKRARANLVMVHRISLTTN